jgi:hypothetical protein
MHREYVRQEQLEDLQKQVKHIHSIIDRMLTTLLTLTTKLDGVVVCRGGK